MSLWTLIPLLVLGYICMVFASGFILTCLSRKTTRDAKKRDDFSFFAFCALLWPIAIPIGGVLFFATAVYDIGVGYIDLLEAAHRKVHAKRNQRVAS